MEIRNFDIEDIHEMAEGAIILDGLDGAIIGITEEFGMDIRILYSVNKILDILTNDGVIDREEALEYYYYNIVGGHFGERNPIFLSDHLVNI